jgi:hypothetical protein
MEHHHEAAVGRRLAELEVGFQVLYLGMRQVIELHALWRRYGL